MTIPTAGERVSDRDGTVHPILHTTETVEGWQYITGCGRLLRSVDGAEPTTRPVTCEWCLA